MKTSTYTQNFHDLEPGNRRVEQGCSQVSQRRISVASMMASDNNPIESEIASDGLASLFGAATGLDCIELLVDYGADAVEFYDDYVQDRASTFLQRQQPTPDPRLWMAAPQPGFAYAA